MADRTSSGGDLGELSGFFFEQIYRAAGYSRREVARRMRQMREKSGGKSRDGIASESGLKDLERRSLVPDRYVRALREIVGDGVFRKHYDRLAERYPADPGVAASRTAEANA